jgi:hypothetical protein
MANQILKKYNWFLIIVGFICVVIWNIRYFENDLKKNGILLNGEIVDVVTAYRGAPKYEYKYFYKGKMYTDQTVTGVKKLNFFIGKTFPVIFSPKTKNSELLISPKDFEKNGIAFPDSLQWVLQYQNN